jgi:hypothetical protein
MSGLLASIPGSSVAGVTTATVVQSLFFTAVSVVIVICVAIFRPRTVSKGSPSDESGGFIASHPVLVAVVVAAAAAARSAAVVAVADYRRRVDAHRADPASL